MMRRCTRSACRRQFPIGGEGPVRCPYCGQVYPRLMPDPEARGEPWGYGLRVETGAMSPIQVWDRFRRGMPEIMEWLAFGGLPRGGFCMDLQCPLTQARELSRRLRRQGLTVEPIPTRVVAHGTLPIYRLRHR